MNYSEKYSCLQKQFYSSMRQGTKSFESTCTIEWCLFHSDFTFYLNTNKDDSQKEVLTDSSKYSDLNTHFTYPVIIPKSANAEHEAIILLHGLNERTWDKYLPWAHSLAEQTGKSVVLFPIAFHMNRSPESWKNPRLMSPFVSERTKNIVDANDLSFANVALSERLSLHPQQFFLSGYQAANDIIKLMDELKSGRHPLFSDKTQVDFFAYSIGVLLSQVLLLANPKKAFDQSKFFFFCGGSVFESMRGTSKFILDNHAFVKIVNFYAQSFKKEADSQNLFSDLLKRSTLGKAFRLLLSRSKLSRKRHKGFRRIRQQISTICLKKDSIMPAIEIKRTLRGTTVEELDFSYPYSHENPFPVFKGDRALLVNQAFELIFRKAALFLN